MRWISSLRPHILIYILCTYIITGFRGEEGKGSREQTVLGVHGRSGNNPDDDAADASNTGDSYCGSPSKTKISNDSPPPIAAAAANAKGHAPTSNGSTTAEAAEEGTNPAASERQPRTPPASSSSPFSSEAVRWLARVRAKIAQMNADRAKACAQSSVREEIAAKARQKTLERNQRRLRHGPGHVPRRAPPGTRGDGGGVATAGEGGAESPVGRREEGNGFRLKEEEEGDGDDFVWRVPKPPVLKVADKSPAMVMNDYSMKAKFQVCAAGQGWVWWKVVCVCALVCTLTLFFFFILVVLCYICSVYMYLITGQVKVVCKYIRQVRLYAHM